MNASTIFTAAEKENIVKTIQMAEQKTSGEIRLHIEDYCKINPFDRALEVFYKLKMDNTKQRNGVLIYVAIKDRKLAIIGDKGIHDVVSNTFWDAVLQDLKQGFAEGAYYASLAKAIEMAGVKLQTYFPIEKNDKDELDNEISFG